MFANSFPLLLTYLKNESAKLLLIGISSFDQDLTLSEEEVKGQAVEHMEPFKKCPMVLSAFCSDAKKEMLNMSFQSFVAYNYKAFM